MTGYLWRGKPDLERLNDQIMAARGDRPRALGANFGLFTWPGAPSSPDCGTERGYRAHQRAGEKACGSCAAAHTWYGRRHAKATP